MSIIATARETITPIRTSIAGLMPDVVNPAETALGTMASHHDEGAAAVMARMNAQQVGTGDMLPIIYAHDAADPTILTNAAGEAKRGSDGLFHLYTTQSPYGETGELVNLPHLTSPNLVDWTYVGDALPTLPKGVRGDTWAPDVFELPGMDRTFMTYSARHDDGHMAIRLMSSKSNDDWVDHGALIESDSVGHTIDSSTFVDRDGRSYMYWGSGPEGIFGAKLGAQTIDGVTVPRIASEPVQVFQPSLDREGFEGMVEGGMVRRNPETGTPQLWYSGDHWAQHYALKVAEAPSGSPLGPFTASRQRPVLDSNEAFTQPGHHDLFTHGDREFAMVHTYAQGASSRSLAMVEVERDAAGWPVINGGAGIPLEPRRAPVVEA